MQFCLSDLPLHNLPTTAMTSRMLREIQHFHQPPAGFTQTPPAYKLWGILLYLQGGLRSVKKKTFQID